MARLFFTFGFVYKFACDFYPMGQNQKEYSHCGGVPAGSL